MSSPTTATRIDEFCAAVRHFLAADDLRTNDSTEFRVDGLAPSVIVAPDSPSQLQRVLTEAAMTGVTVIPIGGATHLRVGNTPASYDVAISLENMNRITAHEPADLTVTVEPGLRLGELQRSLATHGQVLPLDPPCAADATIGGVLAVNAFGPLRHAYGTARDWLIGTRVVHADGSISKSGGRVVKNVTGYDLHKLYVGSLGTLGVLAEATFKLAPLPQTESTLSLSCRSSAEGAALILATGDAGLAVYAAELLSPPAAHAVLGESSWYALLRVAGGDGAVRRSLREVESIARGAGATVQTLDTHSIWGSWSAAFRLRETSLVASLMPSRVGAAMQVLDRRLTGAGARLSATVAAGVIQARLTVTSEPQAIATIDAAREVAAQFDGTVVIESAPPAVKAAMDVFGPTRSDFAIMRRLKDEFDPKHILSPGRFAGRL